MSGPNRSDLEMMSGFMSHLVINELMLSRTCSGKVTLSDVTVCIGQFVLGMSPDVKNSG